MSYSEQEYLELRHRAVPRTSGCDNSSDSDKSYNSDVFEPASVISKSIESKIANTDSLETVSNFALIPYSKNNSFIKTASIRENLNTTIYNPNKFENLSDNSSCDSDSELDTNMAELNVSKALKIIPNFDGTSSELHRFIACCDLVYNPLKETQRANFVELLNVKLVNKAYEVIKYDNYRDWPTLRDILKSQFCVKRSIENIQMEMFNIKQLDSENIKSFANRIELLLNELNDVCLTTEGIDSMKDIKILNCRTALRAFQEGLKDPIKLLVKACRFTSLKEAIAKACDEEVSSFQLPKPSQPVASTSSVKSASILRCQLCNKIGHSARACFSFQNSLPNSSIRPNYNIQRNFSSTSTSNFSPRPNNSVNPPRILYCAYCHYAGHHIEACKKLRFVNNKSRNSTNFNEQPSENEMGLGENSTPQRVRDIRK